MCWRKPGYAGLAGIQIDMDRDDSARIRIAPQPVAGIESVAAHRYYVAGEISSAWRRRGRQSRGSGGSPQPIMSIIRELGDRTEPFEGHLGA